MIAIPAAVGLWAREQRRTDRENVRSLGDLITTRNMQLADVHRDLEILKVEYKQLIQVNIKEMITAWERQVNARALFEVTQARLRLAEQEELTRRELKP